MISSMVYGDLHIHSVYSNGYFGGLPPWVASTPGEIINEAYKKGLKVIAITDHDSLGGIGEAERAAKRRGMVVIPGCEVSSAEGHILAYGVRKPIPKKISARETIKLIHQQNGIAIAAHPFKPLILAGLPRLFFFNNSLGLKTLDLPIDGVETINANLPNSFNRKARTIFSLNPQWVQVGGSDAHLLGLVGNGLTVFLAQVRNSEAALEAIRAGKTKTILKRKNSLPLEALLIIKDQPKAFLRTFLGPRKPLYPNTKLPRRNQKSL